MTIVEKKLQNTSRMGLSFQIKIMTKDREKKQRKKVKMKRKKMKKGEKTKKKKTLTGF